MEDEDEQDDDQVGFKMLLEGDEGFNACRVGEWNRNDEEEEEQTFFMGSSLEESFQDPGLYEQGENNLEEEGVMSDDDFSKGGESSEEEEEMPVNVYKKSKTVKSKTPATVNERNMRSRGDKTNDVADKGKMNKKKTTKKQKITEV